MTYKKNKRETKMKNAAKEIFINLFIFNISQLLSLNKKVLPRDQLKQSKDSSVSFNSIHLFQSA